MKKLMTIVGVASSLLFVPTVLSSTNIAPQALSSTVAKADDVSSLVFEPNWLKQANSNISINSTNFSTYFTTAGNSKYDPTTGVTRLVSNAPNQTGIAYLKGHFSNTDNFLISGEININPGTVAGKSTYGEGLGFAFKPGAASQLGDSGPGLGVRGLNGAFGAVLDTHHEQADWLPGNYIAVFEARDSQNSTSGTSSNSNDLFFDQTLAASLPADSFSQGQYFPFTLAYNAQTQTVTYQVRIGDKGYRADGNANQFFVKGSPLNFAITATNADAPAEINLKINQISFMPGGTVNVKYLSADNNQEIRPAETLKGSLGDKANLTTEINKLKAKGYSLVPTQTIAPDDYDATTKTIPFSGTTDFSNFDYTNVSQDITYYFKKDANTPASNIAATPTSSQSATITPATSSAASSVTAPTSSTPTQSAVQPVDSPTANTPVSEKISDLAKKGAAVYGVNAIYLYKHANFKKSERQVFYQRKPRIYRPMFVVTDTVRSKNGQFRYKVKDVNHHSPSAGKTGYLTANWKYVRPVYYATQPAQITVISPNGVNAYGNKRLTGKAKHYQQGTILKVKSIVNYHLTTRYVLTNGQYVTANRKLVNMGRHATPKVVRAKAVLNRYQTVGLTGKHRQFKKGHSFRVYGYDYSDGYAINQYGKLRYRVAGGYIPASPKLVKISR
ncbi:hypothetical protein YK48G_23150 [Lentilactobacillus fungorum]|uniref:Surface layer protein A domain-containing protein n=1 Tax=Lentilactobacillus fungorum TaxID=2201250 RepID=A0ABQ3W147_9LACO|nr:DUF5776 domain-containing protein [Lentilactobacillus fungorum]GHP14890.1 hypothetical protein YK48G_23150 [Lentilactobacillus fungorum]